MLSITKEPYQVVACVDYADVEQNRIKNWDTNNNDIEGPLLVVPMTGNLSTSFLNIIYLSVINQYSSYKYISTNFSDVDIQVLERSIS